MSFIVQWKIQYCFYKLPQQGQGYCSLEVKSNIEHILYPEVFGADFSITAYKKTFSVGLSYAIITCR